jgi:excisionase family DNA binding protein
MTNTAARQPPLHASGPSRPQAVAEDLCGFESQHGSERRGVPLLLNIELVARSLGVSIRQIRRLVAESRIPYVRIGHLIRFDPDEISEWIDAHRFASQRGS